MIIFTKTHLLAPVQRGAKLLKILGLYMKQICEEEGKLSTSSLNICPDAWKGVGAGGVTPCPLSTTLFSDI